MCFDVVARQLLSAPDGCETSCGKGDDAMLQSFNLAHANTRREANESKKKSEEGKIKLSQIDKVNSRDSARRLSSSWENLGISKRLRALGSQFHLDPLHRFLPKKLPKSTRHPTYGIVCRDCKAFRFPFLIRYTIDDGTHSFFPAREEFALFVPNNNFATLPPRNNASLHQTRRREEENKWFSVSLSRRFFFCAAVLWKSMMMRKLGRNLSTLLSLSLSLALIRVDICFGLLSSARHQKERSQRKASPAESWKSFVHCATLIRCYLFAFAFSLQFTGRIFSFIDFGRL